MNLSAPARLLLRRHVVAARRYAVSGGAERVQRDVLDNLLGRLVHCEYGRNAGLHPGMPYEEFMQRTPVTRYEDIRAHVMRMLAGERDVLWPGLCRRYAQSSGTSGGKSKYIPVTDDSLRENHFAGTRRVMAHYLANVPHSHVFGGRSFILGGSFANELPPEASAPGAKVGDLSAHLIEAIPRVADWFRFPARPVALMEDWCRKLPLLQKLSGACPDLVSLSGVPSWFLGVIKGVLEQAGTDSLADVWPRMEVFFHGGISFEPYRSQYEYYFRDLPGHHFIENYNASEGFFATQDTLDLRQMLLLLDCGIFFEFIPLDKLDQPFPEGVRTAWTVEPGRIYALAITAPNGLVRYLPGDTVKIESTEPLRITIAGRTQSFINAFGEEVMVYNTDAALVAACRRTGAHAANYTAGPVYADGGHKGRHRWLIEWDKEPDVPVDRFAEILDSELQAVNSDYQAKRTGGLFLDCLSVQTAPRGMFDRWLASTGKLGGQRKVPRLTNSPDLIDHMTEIIDNIPPEKHQI